MSLNTRCTPCLGKSKNDVGSNPDCHFKDEVRKWGHISMPKGKENNDPRVVQLRNSWEDYKRQSDEVKSLKNNCKSPHSKAECASYIKKLEKLKDARDVWMKRYLHHECWWSDWSGKTHQGKIEHMWHAIQRAKAAWEELPQYSAPKPTPKKKKTITNKRRSSDNRFQYLGSSSEDEDSSPEIITHVVTTGNTLVGPTKKQKTRKNTTTAEDDRRIARWSRWQEHDDEEQKHAQKVRQQQMTTVRHSQRPQMNTMYSNPRQKTKKKLSKTLSKGAKAKGPSKSRKNRKRSVK
jgi:hypothetical protein